MIIAAIVFGILACACIIHAWRSGQLEKPPTPAEARLVSIRKELWASRPERTK